jgi:GT2 family glycosyltransferase
MMVRRKAIDAVGGLDERFFMYWEDADWCRRMRENGFRVVYYPGVSVCHFVGESSRSRPIRSSLNFHMSAYRLYAKYAEGSAKFLKPIVFAMLAVRLLYTTVFRLMRKQSLPEN